MLTGFFVVFLGGGCERGEAKEIIHMERYGETLQALE